MIYEIKNEFLTVKADSKGAILWSVKDRQEWELIWQGDPKYWDEHGANLFPYIGRMWEGSYTYHGQIYHMDIHGFAKDTEFKLEKNSSTELSFVMEDSEVTLAQYPFHFSMEVKYQLDGKKLHVEYKVENKDKKTMYFGAGGHPGINLPMEAGLSFEDYELEFSRPCEPERILFSSQCFVEGKSAFALEEGQKLSMRHNLFDEDAIVLEGTSGEVTLKSEKGERGVRISYPDMPYVGFWHMPHTESPYVCIEPWSSLPSRQGVKEDLEKQENLVSLQAGGVKIFSWTREIL